MLVILAFLAAIPVPLPDPMGADGPMAKVRKVDPPHECCDGKTGYGFRAVQDFMKGAK